MRVAGHLGTPCLSNLCLVVLQGSNVVEDQDLLEIGILNSAHRQRLLQAIRLLPRVRTVTDLVRPQNTNRSSSRIMGTFCEMCCKKKCIDRLETVMQICCKTELKA